MLPGVGNAYPWPPHRLFRDEVLSNATRRGTLGSAAVSVGAFTVTRRGYRKIIIHQQPAHKVNNLKQLLIETAPRYAQWQYKPYTIGLNQSKVAKSLLALQEQHVD